MADTTTDQTYRERGDGRRFVSLSVAERDWGLSESTLRRLVERGELRLYKPTARRVLLAVAELNRLVESACVG